MFLGSFNGSIKRVHSFQRISLMGKQVIKKWKELRSRVVFDCKWYRVGRFTFKIAPNKIVDDYYMGLFHDAAYVVAFTSAGKLIMVRQYKAAANAITLEVPAGYLEEGESPLIAAKRELLEETGHKARHWRKIGIFYSNPTKERGGKLHVYLATDAEQVTEQNLDDTEHIQILFLSRQEILEKIRKNQINVAGSIASILKVFEMKRAGR